jgi:import inner membrane translocase subunit TIM50
MMLSRAAVRPAANLRAAAAFKATTPLSALRARPSPSILARCMASDSKPPPSSRFNQSPASQSQKPPTSPKSSASATPKTPPESPQEPEQSATPQEADKDAIPDISKLPDLTQGIPSTLEYEMANASEKAAGEEEAPKSGGGGGRGRGKGELPASAYVSSTERKRQKLAMWAFILTGVGSVLGVAYLGRDWSEEELKKKPDIPNGWTPTLWWKRAVARMTDTVTYYQEPAFEKLLPDPDPSFERPYTLCISLEDMLVHSEWTREHGWRIAKRPGVDYFLHYLSQYYEIVLFTTVPFATGEPLVRKLDPYRFIMWPLFREATKYKDGEIVKVGP